MKYVRLFLVTVVLAIACAPTKVIANFREIMLEHERPPIVEIIWEKAFTPCECVHQKLNCSDRALFHIQPEDRCLETPSQVDISRNQISRYPDGFSSAIWVDAARNKMTALPRIDQLNPQIIYLDLSVNRIENVNESFRSLHSLEVLRLRWNHDIANLSFLPNPCALKILDVGNIKLRSLDANVRECRQVQELDISDNFLNTLPSDAFSTFTQLRELKLSSNPIQTLSSQLFRNLTKLEVLKLRRIQLEFIPVHIFDSLLNLKHLDLAGNTIKLLPRGIFADLIHLAILDLSANDFESLPTEAFQSLQSLQELRMSFNIIKTISDRAFWSLPNIKEVYLLHNKISVIGSNLFFNASSLEALTLNGNPITTLPRGLISRFPNLELAFFPCLSDWDEMSHIKYIYTGSCGEIPWRSRAYAAFANVKLLVVSDNVITTIANDTLDGLTSVKALSIGHNEITSLPSKFFSFTPNLTFLSLCKNNLTTLPGDIFFGLIHIMDIMLDNNFMTNVPENLFQGLNKLERIDLSMNQLSSIPPALFNNLPSLYELSLESNKLTTMPSYESTWPPLKLVSLSLNQITEVPTEALRSWLGAGDVQRHVTAIEEAGFGPPPASLRWLLLEAGIAVGRGSELNCRCGCVRRGAAAVFICVNATCPNEEAPSRSWVDTLRDTSEANAVAGNEVDTTSAR